ncbi:arylsulfatase [Rubripirellula amarantea]|uniref:arylsulfatase n=1 Tax=Rubripirellula amarantea TaxID=2527999 RepID=UPI0013EF169D|nr:arylsulfatase [Rubripirellula amarantea]
MLPTRIKTAFAFRWSDALVPSPWVTTKSTTPFAYLIIAMGLASLTLVNRAEVVANEQPNIVIILADDLGFSDLGCYGGEIETPNLDRLAEDGLRFTQFYNTARCWPTRSAMMTGHYAQAIGKDTLIEGKRRGAHNLRPDWAPLISVPLREVGYRSYHSGKWHIDGKPTENGFDRSYWLRDHDRLFGPTKHFLDDKTLKPVTDDESYYSSTAIADHAIECLQDHAAEHSSQPFFSFVTFNVPHFPLQAPAEDIAKYDGRYDDGWQAMRQRRFERMQDLLHLPAKLSPVEPDVGPPYYFADAFEKLGSGEVNRPVDWESLTSAQKEFQANKMEIHAAMVDRMDQEIGRLLDQVDAMGQTDNTLVIFLSDNGASAEIMVRGDGHDQEAMMGTGETYLCLGPGFSNACNTPFRRHKTWVHEGGTSTPLVVRWPKKITDAGALRNQPGHVVDLWPTIADAVTATSRTEETPFEVIGLPGGYDRPGKSLLPTIVANTSVARDHLWWLHEGNRAIIAGDWKLVAAKDQPWELFNLAEDRSECVDLSHTHQERVAELSAMWIAETEKIRQCVDAYTGED